MKINVSFPQTGCQKLIEIEDEVKVKPFFDKRIGHEMEADSLGEEWKGYVVRIAGGNDKQGFPMKQGVLTNTRVRLLLSKGHSCYRPRRTGERKRKSVRGCIVDGNLSVLALVVLKKGDNEIPGLTDKSIPRRLGPKRASKIRKLFNLDKEDDVRRFVIRRPVNVKEGKKPKTVAPKIQRLITPLVLQHRRRRICLAKRRREKNKMAKLEYTKMLMAKHAIEKRRRKESMRRRTSSMMSDTASEASRTEKKAKVEVKKTAPAPKIEKKIDPKSIKKIAPKPSTKPVVKETIKKAGAATAKAATKAAPKGAPAAKPAPKTVPSKTTKPAAPQQKPAPAKAPAPTKPAPAKAAAPKSAPKPAPKPAPAKPAAKSASKPAGSGSKPGGAAKPKPKPKK